MSRLGYTKDGGDSGSYQDQKLVKNPDLAWTHVISQLSTPRCKEFKSSIKL